MMTLQFLGYAALAAGIYVGLAVALGLVLSRRRAPTEPLSEEDRASGRRVLAEARLRQVQDSREQLQGFLNGYLGDAQLAKREAWDRISREPEYLQNLVADSVAGLDDLELLRQLRQLGPAASSLPFKPARRLEEHFQSRRLLGPRQRTVAYLGAVCGLLMLLFPPWVERYEDVTWMLWSINSREVLREQPRGYRLVFAPGFPEGEKENIFTGDLGKTRQKRTVFVINWTRLTLQWAVLLGVVAVLIYLSQDARSGHASATSTAGTRLV